MHFTILSLKKELKLPYKLLEDGFQFQTLSCEAASLEKQQYHHFETFELQIQNTVIKIQNFIHNEKL